MELRLLMNHNILGAHEGIYEKERKKKNVSVRFAETRVVVVVVDEIRKWAHKDSVALL